MSSNASKNATFIGEIIASLAIEITNLAHLAINKL